MVSVENVVDSLLQGQVESAVDQIQQVLSEPEEVGGIQEIGVLLQEAARQEELHRSHIADIITAYLSMKENIATAMSQDKTGDEIGSEISRLEAERQEAVQAAGTVSQQCQAVQEEKEKMQARQREILEMRDSVKEDTTQVLPKTRYTVSLYSCITGIKWDYDCQPDEIKGYVSTRSDVRPFSLDSKQQSKYFITNYLWDLVEAASGTK